MDKQRSNNRNADNRQRRFISWNQKMLEKEVQYTTFYDT